MKFTRYIPNIFTMINLISGCMALLAVFENSPFEAFYWVCLGIFADFFDGFFARLFKAESAVGLQLDSLADLITSGVVPGFTLYQMFLASPQSIPYIEYLGFVVIAASAYRLAKFNVDSRQTESFIGLPTPANTLWLMSLPLIILTSELRWLVAALENIYVLALLVGWSAYLLNAEIPLFSLKIKTWDFKKYRLPFTFVGVSLILILLLGYTGIPLVILGYIAVSMLKNRQKA